ncbi:MAG: polysaccharide pyruvyl transferase family protein [Lachnospiraceae bacterium]
MDKKDGRANDGGVCGGNGRGNKVGIITFHRAINYGALLQCYALQEELKELGKEASVIDYRSEQIENAYRLLWGLNKNKLKSWILCFHNLPDVIRKKKKFRNFCAEYLMLTPKCDRSDIGITCSDMDAIITGSDQVWNMKICDNDYTYMLDYVNDSDKKCSYAVSLGNYQFTDKDKELIGDFRKISLREKCSAKYTEKEVGKQVGNHVDPTLLLDKAQWEKLVEPGKTDKKFIFIYSVHPQEHMVEKAREIAARENLEIIHLHNRVKKDLKEDGVKVIFDASPTEFLTLIHNAEYVITNSFHGTVFSIIYHKKFLSELETKGGFNNRVWELLTALKLRRRVLEPIAYYNKDIDISEDIDWEKVDKDLEALRADSVIYLRDIC